MSIPVGIIVFKEADSKLREKKVINNDTGNIADFLINIYEILGKEAIDTLLKAMRIIEIIL